jgi:tetratricopeptide (TPR) repeat protein
VNTAVFVLIALLAQARPLTPTEPKAQAQALLSEGATLYENGDFAASLEKFKAAYALYPSPKLWLNIGQAQRELGRQVEALESLERFISEAEDPPAEALVDAHRSVAELKSQLGRLVVECPTSGAAVSLDDKSIGRTPLARPVWTTPGKHKLTLRRPGYVAFVQSVEVAVGRARRITAVLRPIDLAVPAPAPAPAVIETNRNAPTVDATPAETPFYARWPFWAVVGGAVLAGGITFALASGRGDDIPKTDLGAQNAF